MRNPLALFALLLVATLARADELPAPVLQALKAAAIPPAATAAWVREVDAASPRLAVNARVAMNPASTMKLVTTYAALDLLGPAYTWKTEAYALATPVDGVLDGAHQHLVEQPGHLQNVHRGQFGRRSAAVALVGRGSWCGERQPRPAREGGNQ